MRGVLSRSLVLSSLLVTAVAQAQPPATTAPAGPLPAPGKKQVTPLPPTPPEPDPWAGRSDLFVPPDLKPTTKVSLGAIARATAANGLQTLVVPRRQIPSAEVTLAVKLPANADPIDRTGVAQFVAQMLRKGTQRRTGDQIAQAIEFVGGELASAAGSGAIYVSCHARTRDLPLCMDLVADVAMHPTFPEGEMDEERDRLTATVNATKDDPQALARSHAVNVFFGDDDARGRPMSLRSVAAIDRKALVELHARWFAPNNALLAVSGDVDDKQVRALVQKSFGSWKKRAVPPLAEPAPQPLPERQKTLPVRLVDKPDATQAALIVIGPGIKHSDKELYAVRIMNFALGGSGFSSRLVKVVRSEGGKTYHVASGFQAARETGAFEASTFTRTAETTATLKLVMDEIGKMRDKGPTDDEVRAAKYNLIGGYGLRLETGADLAEQLLSADLDGLDSQFVAEYPARLDAISVAEAARAAAQHLDPRALIIVGKAAEVGPLLKKAGYTKVEVIHYLDPVSASERKALQVSRAGAAEVMPADAIEGKRLVDLALAAQGGAAAVARIKALRMVGKGTMKAQGQEVPLTVEVRQLVDQAMREDVDLGTMRMVQVFVPGKRGFLRQGDKQMDMPAEMKAEMERATFRDPLFILVHASAPGAKVRGLKPIVDGGVTYDAFEVVSPKNDVTRVLLDPKSHLPARLVYSAEGKQVRDELGDYRVVEGVELPFRAKHDTGDEKIDISYDKIELNPKLAPDLFQ